jgi:MoxR-like ATPase
VLDDQEVSMNPSSTTAADAVSSETAAEAPGRLDPEAFATRADAIEREVGRVIVGQRDLVRQTLTGLLANSHVLLEGVPGLGKTMLVRTISDVIDCTFNRIQFTPDLMPADITGTNILIEEGGSRVFRFQPGPIFANLVLADEINRATPKTQSSLLEAMQEHQVTVARQRFPLDPPFFVLATQNPLEMEGTYPLPEAQLDRFLFKVMVPFPSEEDLISIMDRTTGADMVKAQKVTTADEIAEMQRLARAVPIAPHVTAYAVSVLAATHPNQPRAPGLVRDYVRYGASPRGAQALVTAGKIFALLDGRFNVAIDDIRSAALPSLRHRIILNFEGEAEGITTEAVVRTILDSVAPPTVE